MFVICTGSTHSLTILFLMSPLLVAWVSLALYQLLLLSLSYPLLLLDLLTNSLMFILILVRPMTTCFNLRSSGGLLETRGPLWLILLHLGVLLILHLLMC